MLNLNDGDHQSSLSQQRKRLDASPLLNGKWVRPILKYIIRMKLEGRELQIKEYTIAVEVFGFDSETWTPKPTEANPSGDCTVRYWMCKLRNALNEFYKREGKDDPLIIRIPEKTYVPEIAENGHYSSHHDPPKPAPDTDPILTMSDLAEELHCSKAHISHLINGGVRGLPPLPAIRLGRTKRIRRAAFRIWLASVEQQNGPKSGPVR